jgi:hypothetical protein
VRFRLALDHETRDGYLRNMSGIGPSDYNDVDYTAVRASLVLDLTSNLENYSIASYSRSDTNGSVEEIDLVSSSVRSSVSCRAASWLLSAREAPAFMMCRLRFPLRFRASPSGSSSTRRPGPRVIS